MRRGRQPLLPGEQLRQSSGRGGHPEGQVGDSCIIEGVGAYCSAMSAKNYNSFPEAPEVLRREDGSFALIRKRQLLDQILDNELIP